MLFKIHTDVLREAVNRILSIVDKKSSRPILSYILLNADNKQIELFATDLEVSAKVLVNAEVENKGKVCINAKNLSDILRELPNNTMLQVGHNTEKNAIDLHCNEIYYNLMVNDSNDFPFLDFNDQNPLFSLRAEKLAEIINKTSYAISNDETRLYLNGIFFQEVDQHFRAVATDGHRLALMETDLSINLDILKNGIIIPKKGIFELKKMADHFPNDELKFYLNESFFHASVSNSFYLSVRLISREFPKYQSAIPNKTAFSIVAENGLFMNAVRRIKIMANEKTNDIKLNISRNEISVTAAHPSFGEAVERIPVKYEGQQLTINFNAKYLIDALSVFGETDMTLEFNNELSPVVLRSNNYPDYLGIIMPLNL